MRMIGHEVLLKLGDSTSLVLPIEQRSNQYQIKFFSQFSFDPEVLASVVDSIMLENGIAQHYLVESFDCSVTMAVHSYEVIAGKNMIPCAGRIYPQGCYWIQITLLDTQFVEQEDFGPKEEGKIWLILVLATAIAVILSFLLIRNTKNLKIKEHPHLQSIGQFLFDKKNQELTLNDERIELTDKEAHLLEILYSSANETVEREAILLAVWEDDGDYVGRTLDVFVSKLRKKLELDSSIKIVSVRGIGYKLILNDLDTRN
jgi:hypothetical protein